MRNIVETIGLLEECSTSKMTHRIISAKKKRTIYLLTMIRPVMLDCLSWSVSLFNASLFIHT